MCTRAELQERTKEGGWGTLPRPRLRRKSPGLEADVKFCPSCVH